MLLSHPALLIFNNSKLFSELGQIRDFFTFKSFLNLKLFPVPFPQRDIAEPVPSPWIPVPLLLFLPFTAWIPIFITVPCPLLDIADSVFYRKRLILFRVLCQILLFLLFLDTGIAVSMFSNEYSYVLCKYKLRLLIDTCSCSLFFSNGYMFLFSVLL